jgi:hypothetical protein
MRLPSANPQKQLEKTEIREMAKFGVFTNAGHVPIQTFEGDYIEQDGAFVKVFKNSGSPMIAPKQVGAMHIDKNQYVRELKD